MSDEEHKCHCAHFVVIQTQFKAVSWVLGALIVAVLAVAGTLVAEFISHRMSWSEPSRDGERLFLDRVSKPDPPEQGHVR